MAAWFDAATRDKPDAANRALDILRAMSFRADERALVEHDTIACVGIRKTPKRTSPGLLAQNWFGLGARSTLVRPNSPSPLLP